MTCDKSPSYQEHHEKMVPFERQSNRIFLLLAAVAISTMLILLVIANVNHQLYMKEKKTLNQSNESVSLLFGERHNDLWNSDATINKTISVEPKQVSRKKRHIDGQELGSAKEISMVEFMIQQKQNEAGDYDEKVSNWHRLNRHKFHSDYQLPYQQVQDYRIEENRRFRKKHVPEEPEMNNFNFPEFRTLRKQLGRGYTKYSKLNGPLENEEVQQQKGMSNRNSLTYIFTNNSVYVLDKRLRDKKNGHHRNKEVGYVGYSWIDLAIAAASATAITITIILAIVLITFYCCPKRKKRQFAKNSDGNRWMLDMSNFEVSLSPSTDQYSAVLSPATPGKKTSLLFTNSYIQLERNPSGPLLINQKLTEENLILMKPLLPQTEMERPHRSKSQPFLSVKNAWKN